MQIYRFLTGVDDPAFCHKVTKALSEGWELHGSPSYAFDAAQQRMTAFWATLRGMGKPVPFGRYRADGEMLFALSLRFEEKL